ncbi:flagellar biosynthesis protein FlhB [Bacillus methanolicus PB1]|uniref:Flagellar biosynthetic protein FlhB n=1 Tax=Bacillus methanolicus PB1 TaxID=997296 RepID=I3E4R3_BACMT|nr:flagellar biosynthesis protein FlhB [Bacillus methanolicus]EIJ81484.1 flagellar biosynthesis protein FlhB [Bacillus methanolicus PB1]
MNFLTLDLQFFAGEKTEKATPKKRQDARKKGQAAKSQDVNTAVNLLAVFIFFMFAGEFLLDHILGVFKHSFQNYLVVEMTENNLNSIMIEILKELTSILGPIMLVALIAGAVANYFQIGLLFSPEAVQMKLEKINPIQGFKRIFSLRALVELFKSVLKISFVGIVTFTVLWKRIDEILLLSHKSAGAALAAIASLTVKMGLIASIALLFLASLDYLYQKYDFEKSIRMSKQDIKDEFKNIEGDPLIKSKIKQRQRETAMRRMMQEVPKADVVITNPTHFAVALKYDEQKMDAPYVVAKGADYVAQKIKFIAKENDVITVENRPLARALYEQTDIGETIPEQFFKAVAEILAFVYRIKNKI